MRLIVEYFSSMQNIRQKSDKKSRGEAVYSGFSTDGLHMSLSVLLPEGKHLSRSKTIFPLCVYSGHETR